MEFLSAVECEWDETIVLHASIGDYIVMARRNGNDWFIGAIGDENTHKLGIDFSFLESGKYHMKYYQDGINADRHGSDFKKQLRLINSTDQIQIKLAPGGGWAAHLIKADR